MAVVALTDAVAYVAGHDFTGDSNHLLLQSEAAALNASTFGSDWNKIAGGAKSHQMQMRGLWQSAASDSVDSEAFADLGVTNRVFTIAAKKTEGEPAFMFRSMHARYEILGAYGELAPFALDSHGSDSQGVIRGQLAKAKGDITAVGTFGTVVNLGQVAANQFLYASFHIFAAGTTMQARVASDDSQAFGTPTTRMTDVTFTARGGHWFTRVAGPITDTWYAIQSVGTHTGTFTVAAAIGIGS